MTRFWHGPFGRPENATRLILAHLLLISSNASSTLPYHSYLRRLGAKDALGDKHSSALTIRNQIPSSQDVKHPIRRSKDTRKNDSARAESKNPSDCAPFTSRKLHMVLYHSSGISVRPCFRWVSGSWASFRACGSGLEEVAPREGDGVGCGDGGGRWTEWGALGWVRGLGRCAANFSEKWVTDIQRFRITYID